MKEARSKGKNLSSADFSVLPWVSFGYPLGILTKPGEWTEMVCNLLILLNSYLFHTLRRTLLSNHTLGHTLRCYALLGSHTLDHTLRCHALLSSYVLNCTLRCQIGSDRC